MFSRNIHLLIGILFSLPFFILNAFVALKPSTLTFLLPNTNTFWYEQILIFGLLSLILIGGIISLYPVIKCRRLIIFNIMVAVLFIGFSVMAGYGLGVDFYHCDILKIPNCD